MQKKDCRLYLFGKVNIYNQNFFLNVVTFSQLTFITV